MAQMCRSKWLVPAFSLVLGAIMLGAQWIGGHPGQGAISLAIMAVFGAAILFGGRSETIRGLRGDGRDERFRTIDVHATAVAGTVVILAVIIGFLVEMARGHDGQPFTWLGALGGAAYLAAVAVLRIRT